MADKDDRHPASSFPQLDISALREVGESIRALVAQWAASLQPILEAAQPRLEEFASMMSNAQTVVDHWEKNAPTVLKDAVGARGLIVPVSQMSLSDLGELFTIHRERGDGAVAARIALHYEEIFGAPDFLKHLASTWATRPRLKRRLPLLLQAVRAHELEMFAVSVPTFIAQFEGLVADLASHIGMMNYDDLKKHVATIATGTVAGGMLNTFVNDALLTKFAHGSLAPPFSRHAILHGGDVDYATERNSRTAILLIDQITEFVEDV